MKKQCKKCGLIVTKGKADKCMFCGSTEFYNLERRIPCIFHHWHYSGPKGVHNYHTGFDDVEFCIKCGRIK